MGPPLKEEWRFVSAISGALCVMTIGIVMMQWSPALSLDFHLQVYTFCTHNQMFIVRIFLLWLSCITGAVAFGFAMFGAGTGPIFLDEVSCVGTETNLLECSNGRIGSNVCLHSEDAGVRCQGEVVYVQHY